MRNIISNSKLLSSVSLYCLVCDSSGFTSTFSVKSSKCNFKPTVSRNNVSFLKNNYDDELLFNKENVPPADQEIDCKAINPDENESLVAHPEFCMNKISTSLPDDVLSPDSDLDGIPLPAEKLVNFIDPIELDNAVKEEVIKATASETIAPDMSMKKREKERVAEECKTSCDRGDTKILNEDTLDTDFVFKNVQSSSNALSLLENHDVKDMVSEILPPKDPSPVPVLPSNDTSMELIITPTKTSDDISVISPVEPMLEKSYLMEVESNGFLEPLEEKFFNAGPANDTSIDYSVTPVELRKEDPLPEIPSVKTLIQFAIAAMGVWLCSPILSLIDTSAVGLLSGTAQQAALNPAVSVTEYTALLIAFLYTGTTNLVAAAQENDRLDSKDYKFEKTALAFRSSMQLSGFVGLALGSIIMFFSKPLLSLMIGKNTQMDPVVFGAALKYIRIRALGMPAAAITGSSQAACLGMKDTRSPLIILLLSASVNFIGDMLLVGSSNSWIGGASGAAWATVISQYAAMFLFISCLTKKDGQSKGFFSKVSDGLFPKSSPTKGLLKDQMTKRSLLQFPPLNIAKKFWPYFLPVTTTSAGRVSGYAAMAHVISSSIGTTAMAAQQVILSFFFCLCPAADSISLTGQSYTPALVERMEEKRGNLLDNAKALAKLTKNLIKASVVFALGTLAVVASMPFISHLFTSDPNVIASVNTIVPLVATWFVYHAPAMGAEGILLGRKDLGFLGWTYGFFFFSVPYLFMKIKSAALAGIRPATLTSVWQLFIMYGFSRFSILTFRLMQQTVRMMRRAKKEEKLLQENTAFG